MGTDGISMEPERVKAISEWPCLESVHDVRVFVGFANYYRKFIEGFSKIAGPLNRLTEGIKAGSKGQRSEERKTIEISPEAQEAFQQLKDAFQTAPTLRHFDPELPCRVETDASGRALSGIVHQPVEFEAKTQWHPVAFFSRKLNSAEMNYDTHDQEMLAIVETFKHFRHYLEGSRHQVEVISDHNNLQWFMTTKVLSRRQVRWAEWLSCIDFRVSYRAGKDNGAADALSRRPDYMDKDHSGRWNTEEDTSPALRILQSAIAPENGTPLVANAAIEATLDDQIRQEYPSDKQIGRILKGKEEDEEWTRRWDCQGGTWQYEGKTYIPEGQLRLELLHTAHDDRLAGHFGFTRTLELLRRKSYWPRMRAYVKDYVASCQACERAKPRRHAPHGLLGAEAPPEGPWEDLTLDFVTDLAPSTTLGQTYDSILVVVDRFTKMSHYIPCRKDITAEGLADIFLREILRLHGVPKSIVSDRGPILTSKFWSTLCYYLGIRRGLSTAYHPQTDGQTERQNQTMEQYLRIYCNYEQDDWSRLLSTAEFAYNDSCHAATGTSPFQANYGLNPRRPEWPTTTKDSVAPRAQDLASRMLGLRRTLRERLMRAKADQAKYYNRRHTDIEFAVGDRVYLSAKYLDSVRTSKKLDYKYVGPFSIKKVVNRQAYTLDLPDEMHIHPTFHVSLLEKANVAQESARNQPDAFPIQVTGPDAFEVELIKEEKADEWGNWHYLIGWKGFGPEEDTWEPALNISRATMKAYERRLDLERRRKNEDERKGIRGTRRPRRLR